MKALFRSRKWTLALFGLPLLALAVVLAAKSQNTPAPAGDAPGTSADPLAMVSADGPPAPVPAPAPVIPTLSHAAAEVVKLAQSGVSEDVMSAFVAGSTNHFGLGSEQIIYLNDLGIPTTVVKAMIQRDTDLAATAAQPAAPPVPTDGSVPPPPLPSDTTDQPMATPPADLTDYNPGDDDTTGGANYFYGSLAPYGSWFLVNGYGWCWQPTVSVLNSEWRPYGDRGRWLDTDCGWYWQSDYSWGWAPFHYGRWFFDDHRGWAWRPDRVWGPAWVGWRHSGEFCGWAPLPPSVRFVSGIGLSIGNHRVGLDIGIQPGLFLFVPLSHFADHDWNRHRITGPEATAVFHRTIAANNIRVENNWIVNPGVNPGLVAAVSHTQIHKVMIRDLPAAGGGPFRPDRLERSGNTLTVFRPHLPTGNAEEAGRPQNGVMAKPMDPAPLPDMNFANRPMEPAPIPPNRPAMNPALFQRDVRPQGPVMTVNHSGPPVQPRPISANGPDNGFERADAPDRNPPQTVSAQPQWGTPARVAPAPRYTSPEWGAPARVLSGWEGGQIRQPNYSPAPAAMPAPASRQAEPVVRAEPAYHAPAAQNYSAPAPVEHYSAPAPAAASSSSSSQGSSRTGHQ